jgi:hypothetical protein
MAGWKPQHSRRGPRTTALVAAVVVAGTNPSDSFWFQQGSGNALMVFFQWRLALLERGQRRQASVGG